MQFLTRSPVYCAWRMYDEIPGQCLPMYKCAVCTAQYTLTRGLCVKRQVYSLRTTNCLKRLCLGRRWRQVHSCLSGLFQFFFSTIMSVVSTDTRSVRPRRVLISNWMRHTLCNARYRTILVDLFLLMHIAAAVAFSICMLTVRFFSRSFTWSQQKPSLCTFTLKFSLFENLVLFQQFSRSMEQKV